MVEYSPTTAGVSFAPLLLLLGFVVEFEDGLPEAAGGLSDTIPGDPLQLA